MNVEDISIGDEVWWKEFRRGACKGHVVSRSDTQVVVWDDEARRITFHYPEGVFGEPPERD